MPAKMNALHITIEPEILDLIDQRCGGPKRNAGKLGGRSQWIRKLIYKELQVDQTSNPHETRHLRAYGDLLEVEAPENLTDEELRVFELLNEGMGLNKIAKQLETEGFVTKRNKQWRRETVRLVINKIRSKM